MFRVVGNEWLKNLRYTAISDRNLLKYFGEQAELND